MKFSKAITNIFEPFHEVPLSRLFGYKRNDNGSYSTIEAEALIIKNVITSIAASTNENVLDTLLIELDSCRNRSGRKWTKESLLALCKLIYSGYVMADFHKIIPSRYYPPIISLEICQKAIKKANQYKKRL